LRIGHRIAGRHDLLRAGSEQLAQGLCVALASRGDERGHSLIRRGKRRVIGLLRAGAETDCEEQREARDRQQSRIGSTVAHDGLLAPLSLAAAAMCATWLAGATALTGRVLCTRRLCAAGIECPAARSLLCG